MLGLDVTFMVEAKSRHADYLRAAEAHRLAKRVGQVPATPVMPTEGHVQGPLRLAVMPPSYSEGAPDEPAVIAPAPEAGQAA